MHWRPLRVRRIFASCKYGNPPDTTTVAPTTTPTTPAPILYIGGSTCVAPGPTASSFSCKYKPDLTAIPTGLFDFTTALVYLYGRPRPAMGRGRPPAQAPRVARPPFSATASPFPPACSDRAVSALCRDANRALSRSPVYDLYYPLWRRCGVVMQSAAVNTAGS